MSERPDTPDEARERVCQKAADCLTNGYAFEICDSEVARPAIVTSRSRSGAPLKSMFASGLTRS